VDDRKNLREATRAAMDYLQKLHAQFGDWHLAMAAYNWGEGNVARAIARQQARGLPTDFNGLAPGMPAETRNYVPQIVAWPGWWPCPAAFGASLCPTCRMATP
jgi:membrane-bound lytic murein transglycosylase D